ncbi:RNA polymerase II transcription factor SIII subunit A-domain-containing protein [Aspergillus crustosus]
MPGPTLRQLCTATAIRNVKYLNDIGNLPYALARPFLLKIESPEKLRALELQSPHLMKEDDELWLEFIKRDIPKWDEYELPEQPDCWYDLYCELREEVQRAVDEDAEKLKMALEGISTERAKHSTKFVADRRSVGLPQDRPTAKQRYASYDRKMGGKARVASRTAASTSDAFFDYDRPVAFGTQKPKKKTIFTASKRNTVLAVPTKQLTSRATRVRQAPRSLIEEHRRPAEPPVARRPTLRAPGRSGLQGASEARNHSSPAVNPSLQEREARLRAIATGHTAASASASPSRGSPQISSASRSNLGPSSSGSVRPSFGNLPASSKPQPRAAPVVDTNGLRSSEPTANTELESRQSPPRGILRKRPAANIFLPLKKRR